MSEDIREIGDQLASLSFEQAVLLRDYVIETYGFTLKCLEEIVCEKKPEDMDEWDACSEMYQKYIQSHIVSARG